MGPTLPSHRLVLLHGWGADAEDLIPLGELLIDSNVRKFELISLRAPHNHPQGIGRQWYGLFPPDWDAVPYERSCLRKRLRALATDQVPLEKTVLLGFSQGGAMALASGCDLPLAGVIGCSAYPHPNWSPSKTRPPVFLTHGIFDEVVPLTASEKIIDQLKEDKLEVQLEKFKGGHEIPSQIVPSLIQVLNKWLN